ncbi:hypothetical protein RhiirA5_437292 [Rhizophagus irregularis]|uniref:Uncharacterized protein n=1 Tax=Rhizophagus irregularis TaxID=588596 RepID=A0A2N0NKP7_9GLOM|nr:hypothetical protein RhiirA5_437292 [Rhizophagus irregularis]CAB4377355.1 unnamed protein product [Rhizophagus irregularis]
MPEDNYPSNMYDLLLIDLSSKALHQEVSEMLNVTYLAETTQKELKEVKAIVYGPNYRVIVSLPVKIGRRTSRNVFFIVDTGSPVTYICEEVYEKFKVTIPDSKSYYILLNNHPTITHLPPSKSHFTENNVLGVEFLKSTGADFILKFSEERESAFIRFNNKYEVQSQQQSIPKHIFQLEEISWPGKSYLTFSYRFNN